MKLFQLTVPNIKVPEFVSLLENEYGLGDALMTVESFKSTIIQFRVEDDQVHFVLTELQVRGKDGSHTHRTQVLREEDEGDFPLNPTHPNYPTLPFQALGLGISFGFCDVLDLKASTTVPAAALRRDEAIQGDSMSALAPSQIYSNIVKKAVLTVDTVIIIIMSAAMAGIGLAINNRIYIMAGSLLSRLMGPIMGAR